MLDRHRSEHLGIEPGTAVYEAVTLTLRYGVGLHTEYDWKMELTMEQAVFINRVSMYLVLVETAYAHKHMMNLNELLENNVTN